jgi:hypothetical protein
MRRCWHRWSSQGVESNDKKSAGQAVAGAQTPSRATGSGGVGSLPRRIYDEGTHRRAHPMPTGARVVTAGQRDDSIAFEAVMANLRIGRPGRGRPKTGLTGSWRTRPIPRWRSAPRCVLAASRPDLQQGQRDHRPSPPGQQGWAAAGVRLGGLQDCNVVEATINWLHQTRTVATRYDKMEFVTAAPSTSPRSGSGCVTRPRHIYGTRPSSGHVLR